MTKQVIIGLSFAAMLLLTACGNQGNSAANGETGTSETSEQTSSVSNSTSETETAAIFTGVIQEDAIAGSDDTFSLF